VLMYHDVKSGSIAPGPARKQRDGMHNALEACKHNLIVGLIVFDFARVARDLMITILVRTTLLDLGKGFISVTESELYFPLPNI
jgi:DNA invertase Pin-like site-specific DNA recombinase